MPLGAKHDALERPVSSQEPTQKFNDYSSTSLKTLRGLLQMQHSAKNYPLRNIASVDDLPEIIERVKDEMGIEEVDEDEDEAPAYGLWDDSETGTQYLHDGTVSVFCPDLKDHEPRYRLDVIDGRAIITNMQKSHWVDELFAKAGSTGKHAPANRLRLIMVQTYPRNP